MDEHSGGLMDLRAIVDATARENHCDTLCHGSCNTDIIQWWLHYRSHPTLLFHIIKLISLSNTKHLNNCTHVKHEKFPKSGGRESQECCCCQVIMLTVSSPGNTDPERPAHTTHKRFTQGNETAARCQCWRWWRELAEGWIIIISIIINAVLKGEYVSDT